MAITTLDGIIAGMRVPESLLKLATVVEAVGVPASLWYAAGRPGAAVANSAGVNGRAVDPSLVSGEIPRGNPGSGNAYLARLAAISNFPGVLILIDRLWENSGLSVTSSSAQAITPATLPARDRDGTTDGHDVLAAIEWSATGGAGTPTVTLTYTDEAGNASNSATFLATTTPAAGTFEIFNLAAGDNGIRSPTSFIQSATRVSGTQHLVLFRIISQVGVSAAGVAVAVDAITSGMPRIYNDSVLQLVWIPASSTANQQIMGQYVETQG